MGFKDVINRVRSVFTREKHAVEQAVELSKGMNQPQGGDFSSLYGRYGMEPLLDYLRIEQELVSRFMDYNEMESSPELSAALDIWADEACITGETVVPLLDGTTPTVAELYARDTRQGWIYTSNPVTKEVTAGQFDHVQKIATKVPVYRVVYEDRNGRRGWLRVTADHKFLLTNGSYCRAGDLKPGSSLMALFRMRFKDPERKQEYENVLVHPFKRIWQSTHRMVLKAIGVEVKPGEVVHHEDHNGLNNLPSNLVPKAFEDHQRHHAKHGAANPRFRADVCFSDVLTLLSTGYLSKKSIQKKLGFGFRVLDRLVAAAGYPSWSALKESLFGLSRRSRGHAASPEFVAKAQILADQLVTVLANDPSISLTRAAECLGVARSTLEESATRLGFSRWNLFKQACLAKVAATPVENHKVVEVVPDGIDDVYDLVDSQPHHNFAAGMNGEYVFVKNTQPDVLTGRTVWIESDDVGIKKLLQSLLDQTLQLDEDIWSIARNLCKYGNNYEELLVTQEGVVGLNPLPVETVRRFEREKGLLIGFAQDPSGRFGIVAEDVDKALRGDSAPPPNIAVFETWQMAHFRLMGRSRPSTYGISILEPARWLWRRLLLLEDAALIYRLCLRGDSKIWTPTGHTPIRDLKPGAEVYCYTREGKLKKTRVTYHKHNGKDEIFRVRTAHRDLFANKTHPVLTESWRIVAGKKVRVLEYVEVQKLKTGKYGHRVLMPTKPVGDGEVIHLKLPEVGQRARIKTSEAGKLNRTKPYPWIAKNCGVHHYRARSFFGGTSELPADTAIAVLEANGYDAERLQFRQDWGGEYAVTLPEVVDKDFARWFGFMLGDGFLCSRKHKNGYVAANGVGFACGDDEATNQFYKRLFEKYINPVRFEGDTGYRLGSYCVTSKAFHEFLRLNGFIAGAHNKRIPEWVFRASPDIQWELIEGFIDADGHRYPDGRVDIELCNKEFLEELRVLCMQMGLMCGRVTTRRRKGHFNSVTQKWMKPTTAHHLTLHYKKLKHTENILEVSKLAADDIYDIGVEADEHNFVADGLVVHNTRTPTRWIFYIDVGKLPPSQALGQIRKIKQEFTKNKFVNERGGVDLRYSPLASDENLFIPVVDGKRTTEVDLMATPEWQVMDDINYFKDKLFSAIKIPKAYLSEESDQRSRVLSLLDIRFARGVMRVQRELKTGIRKICKVHLAAIGIDPEKVSFDVFLTVPSWAYELAQIEVRNAKAEFADKVSAYLPERAIIKLIFGFSDEEIDALRKEKDEEAGGGGMEEPGAGGEPGGEEPEKKKPDQRKTGGSPIDLPGAARVAGRETEAKAYKLLVEHMEKLTKSNAKLAKKFEELKDFSHELRSSMFFKGSHGSKTRAVPSFGNGGGRANPE